MEAILTHVASYWYLYGPLLWLVLSVVNSAREHYSKARPAVVAWIDRVLEAISFLCSLGAQRYPGAWGKFKWPLTSVPPSSEAITIRERVNKLKLGGGLGLILALVCALHIGGCATTSTGEKQIDTCQALALAASGHTVAKGAAEMVCMALPKAQRAKCLEQATKYSAIGGVLIDMASGIARACGL